MTQPKALYLADDLAKYLGGNTATQAAAELRRLHAECEHHKAWVAHITAENKSLEAQRDALLEALKELMVAADGVNAGPQTWLTRARAAIKAAEENT